MNGPSTRPAVLFLTRKFPPSVGGMETLAHDVWAMLAAQPGLDLRLVAHGGSNTGIVPFLVRAVRALWDVRRSGAVVLTGDVLLFLLLRPATVVLRIRPATMAMGKDVVWQFPGYGRLVRRALPGARAVLAISTATAQAVEAAGVPEDRVRVVTLGVEVPTPLSRVDARTAVLARLGAAPDDVILLTLGRLVRRKGVAWFIREVMPSLPSHIRYVVAGDGEDADAVRAARAGLVDPDRVHLLGRVDDLDRELLMHGCDVFVQPNVRVPGDMEGFGLVAVEAAMRGALVVASELEGLRDAVVDGTTGRLLAPEDPEVWSAALTELADDPAATRDRAAQFADACRARYSRERMGAELVALLGATAVSG